MIAKKTLSAEEVNEIGEMYKHFPIKSAACIEGLKIIQKHQRWISDDAVKELAVILDMSPDAIDSIATYYSLLFRRPVGKHVVMVCNSVSCWIMGYEKIASGLKSRLAIDYGETTADNRFTLLTIPCLGTCDHAPALIIGEDLHRDLTTDKLDSLLELYR